MFPDNKPKLFDVNNKSDKFIFVKLPYLFVITHGRYTFYKVYLMLLSD